jgi:hypothetical protein
VIARHDLDRRSLVAMAILIATCVLILVISVFGFSNFYNRYIKLSAAQSYVAGAGELENEQQALMDRYFALQRIDRELKGDSIIVSYNSRVELVLEKVKLFELELKEIEYGKESHNGDIRYLPVKFELSGGFDKLLLIIEYIENEIQVMGIIRLELTASGASSTDIGMSATINFYRLAR